MALTSGINAVLAALGLLLLTFHAQSLQVCPSLSCPTPSGFFAHPTHCDGYVKCSGDVAVIKHCPEGLHYHPVLKRCDYPRFAQCNITARLLESGCSLKVSLLKTRVQVDVVDSSMECDCDCCYKPHDECTKYYECNEDNEAFVRECSDGLVFNPDIENCDFPSNYQCPTKAPPVCECECRYPVEDECNAFFDCHDGEPDKVYCPDGLFFNPATGVCQLHCPQTTPRPPTTKPHTTTTTTTTPPPTTTTTTTTPRSTTTTTTTTPPSKTTTTSTTPTTTTTTPTPPTTPSPFTCVDCSSGQQYFQHPTDCRKYIQCTPYGPQEMACPQHKVWDQTILNCNYDTTAPCITGNYVAPNGTCVHPTTTTSSTTTTTSTTTKSTTTTTSDSNCDVVCPHAQGLFPHPQKCTLWVHCDHNIPYVKDCPAGLHFNPQLKVCDWPHDAGCTSGLDNSCEIPTPITTTPATNATVPTPSPFCDCQCCHKPADDCTAFYYCDEDQSLSYHVCSDGLVFHPELSTCVYADMYPECAVTEPPPVCLCDCFYPSEVCSSYFYCNNGEPVKFECPEGLLWNQDKKTCDLPQYVNCTVPTRH